MKYIVSFLLIFIFIGILISNFHIDAPKLDIRGLWNEFTKPYEQLNYLEYNNNNYGFFNVFRDIYNYIIAFLNAIITIVNAVWIAFQFLFKLAVFIGTIIWFLFAFITFLFSIPFLNIVISIILIIIVWDFLKFIRGIAYR
jgi:uncharacterized membrane protein